MFPHTHTLLPLVHLEIFTDSRNGPRQNVVALVNPQAAPLWGHGVPGWQRPRRANSCRACRRTPCWAAHLRSGCRRGGPHCGGVQCSSARCHGWERCRAVAPNLARTADAATQRGWNRVIAVTHDSDWRRHAQPVSAQWRPVWCRPCSTTMGCGKWRGVPRMGTIRVSRRRHRRL